MSFKEDRGYRKSDRGVHKYLNVRHLQESKGSASTDVPIHLIKIKNKREAIFLSVMN